MAKSKYATVNLKWAKAQLATWKAYIDSHPFEKMEDRVKFKETKGGGIMPIVIASIEAQQKNIRETVKEYLALLEVVDRMEAEEEEKETSTYGDVAASPRMKLYDGKADDE